MVRAKFGGFSGNQLTEAILSAVSGIEFKSFEAGVHSRDEAKKLSLRRETVSFLESSGHEYVPNGSPDVCILVDAENGFVEAIPQSVFVEGAYNKLKRGIAQTFHYCYKCKGRGCTFCSGKGKLSELSVQEAIDSVLLSAFGSRESRFHGCGREDADVLMLGKGRPFVFEVIEPQKRSLALRPLENIVNSVFLGKVQVHGLKYCKKERVAELKNTEFGKIYSTKCSAKKPVSREALAGLVGKQFHVLQQTPERVEKRRAMKDREKSAQISKAELLASGSFHVEILASHGLYIKEFVSGDNGRTRPSVSSLLGIECHCDELDVLEIVFGK
ncbi:MAG: tRNA pseudouridine(54/55) synthase Pus10 [Candidatus Diapherotrites archaeon]|uniref:tRNA pseudouridine(55) synthase n=1 Tax=Candidatus Iainarchaeum sp. TaxID=3101447 RepID=A0A8T3YQJ4_9ARCH|nr:tRNA pseudouridine(54/55) synthase Pus10 [Candidatus Diapherotrites archaeon]